MLTHPSRGLLRDYEPSDGTFSSNSGDTAARNVDTLHEHPISDQNPIRATSTHKHLELI